MTLKRTATFCVLCLLAAATVSAQARQAPTTLSHELLWSFQRVGAPVPSADGKWVVFSVSEPSYDPLKEVSDLWIVPADGSAGPRRLTSTKGTESGPAWSPDSTRIAFAAKRDDDEVNQIYVLDVVRGGEAQRVTAAPTAASVPRWSPDGQKILFQAALWPGATDEESNRKVVQERKNIKSKVRIYDSFPIRDFDHWIEESKSQLWVVDVAGDRKARSLFGASKAAARPGFGGTALGGVWSPDGQSVVFMAAEDEGVAARAAVVTHLWQVPASGGEPKRLTPDGWDFGAPAFRPDGKALCYSVSEAKPVIYQLTGWDVPPGLSAGRRRRRCRLSQKGSTGHSGAGRLPPTVRRFTSPPKIPATSASTRSRRRAARRRWPWTLRKACTRICRRPCAGRRRSRSRTGKAQFVRPRSSASIRRPATAPS